MEYCFYCSDDSKRKSLMIEIIKTQCSTIYLNKDQKHLGRIVVKLNNHKTEYFQLSEQEQSCFFSDLSIASKAIFNLYKPNKLNYATYGDKAPHLHVHVVPKYKDKLNWGAPFDDSLEAKKLTDSKYDQMVCEIRKEIERLID